MAILISEVLLREKQNIQQQNFILVSIEPNTSVIQV